MSTVRTPFIIRKALPMQLKRNNEMKKVTLSTTGADLENILKNKKFAHISGKKLKVTETRDKR